MSMLILVLLLIVVSFFIGAISSEYLAPRRPVLHHAPAICLTIKDKSKIPRYIYDQYERYAPEYRLVVYDDEECVQFLKSRYGHRYARKFLSIRKGCHRADFFRYAYLYEHGGVYLDVKTILIKPLSEIFTRDEICYTVLSLNPGSIYNGIIRTPPRNPFMSILLDYMLRNPSLDKEPNNMLVNTFQAFDVLKSLKAGTGGEEPLPGFNRVREASDTVLFVEKHIADPKSRKDRYGFNVFAMDAAGAPVFKIRDANYTENYA